jgi:hypothetical protein
MKRQSLDFLIKTRSTPQSVCHLNNPRDPRFSLLAIIPITLFISYSSPTTLKLGLAGGFAPKLRSIVLSADTGGADLSNPTE